MDVQQFTRIVTAASDIVQGVPVLIYDRQSNSDEAFVWWYQYPSVSLHHMNISSDTPGAVLEEHTLDFAQVIADRIIEQEE